MSTPEQRFRESLRTININVSDRESNGGIGDTFRRFGDSAGSFFGNIRSQVQGYVPLGAQEEESWFSLSTTERLIGFVACVAGGLLCFFLAFFLWLPMIVFAPHKFAVTYTVGSILCLASIALLRGPVAWARHMVSKERIPFSAAYLGSMAATLYFAVGARNYVLTIVCSVVQIIALIYYFVSYLPGGTTTLMFGGRFMARQASSLLPI
ncbi:uncharacterized protein VTP21DRAFT_599 [Calcarisporiella thermophila]|uniref:uncharacterized protein n=1 Tax=Calcarisporiella thermophila TaxID=911321 RepID=UPI003744949D